MSDTPAPKPTPPAAPKRPYQLVLYVGAAAPTLEDVRVVNLTPAHDTAEAVLDALRAAELTPADLRSRALFLADADAAFRTRALMVYAALIGFAKRRLDAAFDMDSEPIQAAEFDKSLRKARDNGKPAEVVAQVQIGGPERTDMPQVHIAGGFTPELVTAIRYARRARFTPPEALQLALPQLIAVAALRGRGETDKLPYLVNGDEPVEVEDGAVVGVCLNTLRRDAEELRRSLRTGNRDAVAPAVELTPRQQHLVAAAAVPVEETLRRLGAESKMVPAPAVEGEEEKMIEVWHCLKPQNHTNGDATPSARVSEMRGETHGFRCFRCLPEKVDSLRLVMWANGVSADEAADWLLSA